jgi:hypothetical protein
LAKSNINCKNQLARKALPGAAFHQQWWCMRKLTQNAYRGCGTVAVLYFGLLSSGEAASCEFERRDEAGSVGTKKTLGDAFGVPRGFSLHLLSVSFSSLLPSSWLPLIYSPFHFSWTMQLTTVATD